MSEQNTRIAGLQRSVTTLQQREEYRVKIARVTCAAGFGSGLERGVPGVHDTCTGCTVYRIHVQDLPCTGYMYRMYRVQDTCTGCTVYRIHVQDVPCTGYMYRMYRVQDTCTGCTVYRIHVQDVPCTGYMYRMCRVHSLDVSSWHASPDRSYSSEIRQTS
ncbi:hypothetical protein RRG08_018755 [Elysia crispata]|uniref:Uncharacterized protein n=1 Tax=Elysia crispata TaxID=231223 RepID=A0AAE1DAC4_9GAST|nr:hypothetical protein RRG08_018755 [Elysia crispata]